MPMIVKVTSERPAKASADLLVMPVEESLEMTEDLVPKLKEHLRQLARARGFKGEWSQALVLPRVPEAAALAVALIGLGKNESPARQQEALRRGLGMVVQDAWVHGLRTITVCLRDRAKAMAQVAVEGVEMANYRYTEASKKLREQHSRQSIRRLEILVDQQEQAAAKKAVAQARQIMRGVELARNLVNHPADKMYPEALVQVAKGLAKKSPRMRVSIMNREQAAKAGFNAFLAVARGSVHPPFVIHWVYKPVKPTEKRVVLIGKGITFDSGGLSLKPAEHMESMKIDMAGAAAVLGVMDVLPGIAPEVEVHGIIAACENMPSGSAYRPGDVLTAKNGMTIEVLNTDAEGRLTLADMLAYAADLEPTAVIDVATLTGACMVALGETVAGLFSTDDGLAEKLIMNSHRTGEQLVRLPLPEELRPLLDSPVADIKNLAGTRYGGAITAALFLKEFTGGVSWAHLDIAGPAFAESVRLPYWQPGATGFGVRLLVEYLRSQ